MENIYMVLLVPLLFVLFKRFNSAQVAWCIKVGKVFACGALFFGLSSVLYVNGSQAALFAELTEKGTQVFLGMRDIIYVVAGFGIIGVAVGGFFGTLNWKWLGAIIIGLVIIAATAAFINYIVGAEVIENQDTLK